MCSDTFLHDRWQGFDWVGRNKLQRTTVMRGSSTASAVDEDSLTSDINKSIK